MHVLQSKVLSPTLKNGVDVNVAVVSLNPANYVDPPHLAKA